MSKKKSKDKKGSKKAAVEPKKIKGKKPQGSEPAPKVSKKKVKANAELVVLPTVDLELEALDDVERAALEEYRRTVAFNRARKEEEPSPVIEADSWQFDMDNSIFSLQREAQPVAQLAMDEDSLRTLVQGINSAYILPDDEPPSYQVRIPDLYDAPPVLSLIKGGIVVGSLALDEDFNESVGPLLQARYPQEPQEPAWSRFKAWVKAHKVRTVLLALLAIPVLVLLVEGAYNSIVGSFS